MTTTLGYRDPETHRDFLIEVGERDEERGGYWAMEYSEETMSGVGGIFFASDDQIKAHGTASARTEWIKVAEMAREAHHLAAGEGGGAEYKRSQDAFKAALHVAYPTLDKCGLYGLWVDCMEPVAYCASTYAAMDRERQRKYQAIGGAFDN